AVIGHLALTHIMSVRHGIDERAGPFAAALRAFLHRINGAEEFTALLAFHFKQLVPVFWSDAFQKPAKHFLCAVRPACRIEASIAPAGRTVSADIIDSSRFTECCPGGGGTEGGQCRAQDHRHAVAFTLGMHWPVRSLHDAVSP